MADDPFNTADIVDAAITNWHRLRQGVAPAVGDRRVRTWLFETVATEMNDPNTHSFLMFEIAGGLYDRGHPADAFALLRWLGECYVRDSDTDLATRVLMALTDTCTGMGTSDPANKPGATRVLRDVVDTVRWPVHPDVERALCRAFVYLGYLGTAMPSMPRRSRAVKNHTAPWAEIVRRWRHSDDPQICARVAQALHNEAVIWLQFGREDVARQKFATITTLFGADRAGVDPELAQWLTRADHASTLLDLFTIGEPELNLAYLRRQRYWDRRRHRKNPIAWLLAGAPRNHMRTIVRRARDTHRLSAGKVRSWLCSGQPFVLLLRNFELAEQTGTSSLAASMDDPAVPFGDHTRVITLGGFVPVLNELASSVPMVQVASTTAGELEMTPLGGEVVPEARLYLPAATWFETVAKLIAVADQVILWAAELTSGVASELDCLRAHERTEDTVVLLDDPPDAVTRALLPRGAGDRLTPEHPALHGFPHVLAGGRLRGRTVADCPPLLRLVDRLAAAGAEGVEAQLATTRARLDGLAPRSP